MNGTVTMPLADRLLALRTRSRMTQQDLAQKAGLTLSVVCKIEQGMTNDPKWSSVVKLARALGCPLDALDDERPAGA